MAPNSEPEFIPALSIPSYPVMGYDGGAEAGLIYISADENFSHFASNTPASEQVTIFPNGYPSIGAQPCTKCGHHEDGRINTTNTSTNISQPISGVNNTGHELPVHGAYQINDSSLFNENGIANQTPFMSYGHYNTLTWNEVPMPYGNYNILPPNELVPPGFGYDQGYEDQFMFSQNVAVLGDNFQQFDVTPNIMASPTAANVPTGPATAIQGPPTATQPAPGQRVPCTLCTRTFGRTSDLTRHMTSIHHVGPQVLHLCNVLGCPKSFGRGYSRQDKLKEHLKKVHDL
ncbi:C2H2 finger domain protein [Rutstroemia sp. NJR-2017a WRK4]|nr:C2H2 finger domain protein [Rutstroemia sp. NJR-2017a WRK4]